MVLFVIFAGTMVLMITPFLYYQGLTVLAVGVALLGLLVFSPWIWFQLWPFWLERKERQVNE